MQVNIRKKNQKQYVSLNATQNLMNNSLDLTSQPGQPTTYSTIAAG